ncbi:MAG: hypothetical protein JWQ74_2921 [Marmoricola sp.]|nr:hypothetical protein [Marmoricola sp.]
MNRALAGLFLAALAVVGLPVTASAASDSPIIFASSTSYSGQPRPYSIQVFNRLDGGRVSATIGGRSASCRATAAPNGVGRWTCTASGRLSLGSVNINARATGGGKTLSASKRINVSSRFGISSRTSPSAPGGSFSVRGSFDHLSGTNDFRVSATVSAGGVTVLGQAGVGCSTSGSSYTCFLKSSASGTATSYTVTVTESGAGSRSASTTIAIPVNSTPRAPSFTSKPTIAIKKQPATITGTAAAGSAIQVVVDPPASGPNWASPTTSCTANANGAWSCKLPKSYAAGTHTIVARAISQADATRISPTSSFTFKVKAAAVKPTPTPTAEPTPTPPVDEPEPTPEPEPVKAPLGSGLSDLLGLLVLGLAVLSLARPGSLSRITGGRSTAFSDTEPVVADERELVGPGDNSPSWAAFGHEATDFWSRTAPAYVARHSPFLGRLAVDGVTIRAIFGSAWWLMPIGGAALGVASAAQTAYLAVPPSLGLLLGVMVLSCFDALSGFVASVVFGILVVGDFSAHGVATILAVGILWTSLPLVAGAIRPLRRSGQPSLRYRWDRFADLLLAALLAGWLAQLLTAAFDAFAGTATGIPADADTIGIVAAVAVAARVLVGQAADLWWPERLRFTESTEDLPAPTWLAVVSGSVLRVAAFAFLGHVFIGSCWQWYVGVLLFALPEIAVLLQRRSVLPPRFTIPLPKGLTQVFGLVIIGTVVAAVAVNRSGSDTSALRAAFVVVGLLPSLAALARSLQDDTRETSPTTWDLQLAGAGILLTTVILALHGYDY